MASSEDKNKLSGHHKFWLGVWAIFGVTTVLYGLVMGGGS